MYSYKTGISQIDAERGGFDAGSNILILAPPMSYAEQLAFALARPLPGEYSIILSTNERASEVVDYFKQTGSDKNHNWSINDLDFAPSCRTPDGHPVADLRLHDGPSHGGHPGHLAFVEIGLVHPDDGNNLFGPVILGVSYCSAKVNF